jgi:hypothetical protein
VQSHVQTRLRNLVIEASVDSFGAPGDSGALLVDDGDQGVGLLWRRGEHDPSLAFACHIHPALDRLNLTLMTHALS